MSATHAGRRDIILTATALLAIVVLVLLVGVCGPVGSVQATEMGKLTGIRRALKMYFNEHPERFCTAGVSDAAIAVSRMNESEGTNRSVFADRYGSEYIIVFVNRNTIAIRSKGPNLTDDGGDKDDLQCTLDNMWKNCEE